MYEKHRIIIMYCCSGCHREYKSKSGCKTHERRCWYLPATQACPTCRFSSVNEKEEYHDSGIAIVRDDGYDCELKTFKGHTGEYVAYNLSVGCRMHKPLTKEDFYYHGEEWYEYLPPWLKERVDLGQ